jgi:hypothetical protein
MTRKLWMAACLLAILLTPAALQAQDKPDYSGEWTLVPAKSDFGQMPAPEKLVMKVDQKGDEFKIATTQTGPQGERTNDQSLIVNGQEQTRTTQRGEVKLTPKWEGGKLTVKQLMKIQDNDIKILETWSLSEDRKALTVTRDIESPMGQMTIKMVLDKK